AVKALYAFIWNDFCDWYVESAKARLYGDDAGARREVSGTLLFVLERAVALAHPVMPFVTEEIWSFLPGDRGLLLDSPMPQPETAHHDAVLEDAARQHMEVVSEARRIVNTGEVPAVTVPDGFLFRSLL